MATKGTDAALPALEARGLTLAWDADAPVADGLALEVGEGEIVCLVGRSGAGKSTILHALAGLLVPQQGQVLLDGRDVTGMPGQVGYMLQKDLLLPSMRVIDNACLPLLLARIPKRQAREQVRPLLAEFGLSSYADSWPHELSGGMRQRVAFARTCMCGSEVVLLDEPFSALDAITRAEVREWFLGQVRARGLSVLMITHDAYEACAMADRVYVLGGSHPSRIVGEVACRHAGGDGDEQALLASRREVLALLQGSSPNGSGKDASYASNTAVPPT